MSRGLPTTLFLLLCALIGAAGCADPNPTFVFDAAPATKDGGTDTSASSAADAGQDGSDANDASDATGGGQ